MDNVVQSVRQSVMNFRVKRCCWLAPLRGGLMVLGYFNLAVGVLLAVGTSSGSLAPLLQRAQMALMEGEYYTSVCIVSPVVDVAAAVLLLCGLHREDACLLSLFSVVSSCCVALSVAVYVVVCATLTAVDLIAIFCTEVYQMYVIFLVRSLIIEIRLKRSSYRHCGGDRGVLVSKVSKMPSIIERVDVESQVDIQKPPTAEPQLEPTDQGTVQGSQLLATETTTQHVQVQVENAEVVPESSHVTLPRSAVTPTIDVVTPTIEVVTPTIEVVTPTIEVVTNPPAPEGSSPTPAVDVVIERDGNIRNDDVTLKTRRKQCRVM